MQLSQEVCDLNILLTVSIYISLTNIKFSLSPGWGFKYICRIKKYYKTKKQMERKTTLYRLELRKTKNVSDKAKYEGYLFLKNVYNRIKDKESKT